VRRRLVEETENDPLDERQFGPGGACQEPIVTLTDCV